MVHGPGIGTGGVVRPLEWVIFLRGCICIYIQTSRFNLTPSSPVQTFTTVHTFTTALLFTTALVFTGSVVWMREGFFSFVRMGCVRTAIVRTVIRQCLSLSISYSGRL